MVVQDTPDAMVELAGVARRFAQRWVLRGVDLRVERGAVVAVTGRNGSGKTTLLRVVSTLLPPTRGAVRVLGLDPRTDGSLVRERVGLLAHRAGVYDDLTAEENLVFAQRMAGSRADRAAVARALGRADLSTVARERVRGFSAGMRRRLALARLLLRPPDLLLLDEPYASFDQDGIELVNALAAETAARGGAVLLATHDLARAHGGVTHRIHLEGGRPTAAREAQPLPPERLLHTAANGGVV